MSLSSLVPDVVMHAVNPDWEAPPSDSISCATFVMFRTRLECRHAGIEYSAVLQASFTACHELEDTYPCQTLLQSLSARLPASCSIHGSHKYLGFMCPSCRPACRQLCGRNSNESVRKPLATKEALLVAARSSGAVANSEDIERVLDRFGKPQHAGRVHSMQRAQSF